MRTNHRRRRGEIGRFTVVKVGPRWGLTHHRLSRGEIGRFRVVKVGSRGHSLLWVKVRGPPAEEGPGVVVLVMWVGGALGLLPKEAALVRLGQGSCTCSCSCSRLLY